MLTGPPPKFNGTRDILMSARGQFFMSADTAGSTNPKRQSAHQGERVAGGLVGQTRVRRIESTERVAP
jgi:hypothetical protein